MQSVKSSVKIWNFVNYYLLRTITDIASRSRLWFTLQSGNAESFPTPVIEFKPLKLEPTKPWKYSTFDWFCWRCKRYWVYAWSKPGLWSVRYTIISGMSRTVWLSVISFQLALNSTEIQASCSTVYQGEQLIIGGWNERYQVGFYCLLTVQYLILKKCP